MSDSDVIIRAENVSKTYRLYAKPHYRFLDMLGWLHKPNAYTEHSALSNINLTIKRGEKVAFIGRNGAGKSTLLKMITGVIEPSAGNLVVSQGAHALLQIGSGFHQDFTGRQNALAYLAHLGVSGEEAKRKLVDIVEFAELEEYIDQPIKTYSTGMVARLMFATSTVIEPELLVLDEILGVGDAYFSNKSFERIREMCSGGRTTVLVVTHDIYSAQKLSDRMVWIDKGRVLLDDVPEVVVRGYEDSIRLQEESRLREKVRLAIKSGAQAEETAAYLEIRTSDGRPPKKPIFFEKIALGSEQDELAILSWDGSNSNAEAVNVGASWGAPDVVNGVQGRWMLAHGVFPKIAVQFNVPRGKLNTALIGKQLAMQIDARTEEGATLVGELMIEGQIYRFDDCEVSKTSANSKRLALRAPAAGVGGRAVNTSGQLGTGAVRLNHVRLLNDQSEDTFWVRHGNPASFLLEFQVVDAELSEKCDICVIFFRAGTRENICRIVTRDILLDAKRPTTTVRLDLDAVVLGVGSYAVWVFVARNGYLAKQQDTFYSLNPDVYLSQPDVLEFSVAGDLIASNTAFVGQGRWSAVDV